MSSAPTNAYQRVDQQNTLEDVRQQIYDVSPEETPFMSNAPVGNAENTKHEWDNDELDPVNVANAWKDGQLFNPAAITSPSRLDNECQISRKDFVISRRARKVKKTGQRDEVARQVARKGVELKRDCEAIGLHNQAKLADSDGDTAPLLAGFPTWIIGTTDGRADRGATGADPASLGAVKTDGTARALSESGLLGISQGIYNESTIKPNVLMLDVASKGNFSGYMFTDDNKRIATPYQDHGANPRGGLTVNGSVDVWVSDYAVLEVVPNRFIPVRLAGTGYDSFMYNTGYVDYVYFDTMQTDAMAKTADTDDRMVLADYTICPKNPKTNGTFADINEGLAMVQ